MQWLCHGMAADNKLKTFGLHLGRGIQPCIHMVKYPVFHGHIPEDLLDAIFLWLAAVGGGKKSWRKEK
jgi:hypothetical protein